MNRTRVALPALAPALALAVLATALPACGREDPPVRPQAELTESFPVRGIVVRFDPADPPSPPATAGAPPSPAPPAPAPPQGPAPGPRPRVDRSFHPPPMAPGPPAAPKPAGRTRAEALARAEELVARARAPGASFEALAAEASDDEGARAEGGFVGFVSPWSAAPRLILDAVARLPVGGISDPVEAGKAFHIVQRLARDAGKSLEEKLVLSLDGFLAPWWPLASGVDRTVTKENAYAAAAKAVASLRGGADLGVVIGSVPGPLVYRESLRQSAGPGVAALWKAASELPPLTEWTDPVETPRGWAVVRRVPYLRAYVRHIVVHHRGSAVSAPPERMAEEARARAEDAWRAVTADRSQWETVVRSISDEPPSRDRGGFLGEVSTVEPTSRRFAPEIESAILRLKPGEISEVVETRFGYHVFWRVD